VEKLIPYILLGILQGATEFLPVSSSGHLVAAQAVFDVGAPGVLLEVCLHFGTLLAILFVLRRDIVQLVKDAAVGAALLLRRTPASERSRRAPAFGTAVAILVGTIPAAVIGIALHDGIERVFEGSPAIAGALLVVTGIALVASRWARPGTTETVAPGRGLLIGLAQAAALLPGISRSGSTIVAGYFLGVQPRAAARFSFLLAVPALAGAMLLEMVRLLSDGADGFSLEGGHLMALACGTAAAAAVGCICLVLLLKIVSRGALHWFAAWCIPLGAALVAYGVAR